MTRASGYLTFVFLAASVAPIANAACSPEETESEIKASVDIPGFEAEATGLQLGSGRLSKGIDGAKVESGIWKVSAQDIQKIGEFLGTITDVNAAIGLFQKDGDRVMVNPGMNVKRDGPKVSLCVPSAQSAAPPPVPEPKSTRAKRLSSIDEFRGDCKAAADQWSETRDRRYRVPVLFDREGVRCYSPPVVRVGDLLVVGMFLDAGETVPDHVSVDFTNCPQESATPEILANGEFPELQSAFKAERATLVYLDSRACGGESPVVSVRIGTGEAAVATPYTLSQYKRYRATFHMGAVYTELHDPTFKLRDDEGTNLIYNSEPEEKGPEYVAALVIQGIGHYFTNFRSSKNASDTDSWLYKGRDPIHDGGFLDRLGFVMSAGIEHPGERFGVGLSYEIAYGVNIVGLYEMAKIKQLEGFEIGDPFTGDAADIPTRKEWESKVSIGLTFDLAYATKLFTGAKSGG